MLIDHNEMQSLNFCLVLQLIIIFQSKHFLEQISEDTEGNAINSFDWICLMSIKLKDIQSIVT